MPQQYIHWLSLRPLALRVVLRTGPGRPGPSRAGSFQSLRRRGMEWGLVLQIRKAPAVLQMPKQFCVVAQKTPHVTEILRLNNVRI